MNRDLPGCPGAGAAQLVGRREELSVLGGLIDAVHEVESRVLVVRGEPGVGKTTLLDYVAGRRLASRPRVPGEGFTNRTRTSRSTTNSPPAVTLRGGLVAHK